MFFITTFICIIIFSGCSSKPLVLKKPPEDIKEPQTMTADGLKTLLSQHNWNAVQVAKSMGPGSSSTLKPYLDHEDELIRLLAVDCIVAADGSEAISLLIYALEDTNEQVRINSVNGLHKHLPSGQELKLLEIWDKTRDIYLKQQIPIIIGRLSNPDMIPHLNQRLARNQVEDNQEIHDGIIVGLAKLGDTQAQNRYGKLLSEARGERIKDLIDLEQFLDEPWVISLLLPVLDRKEKAIDLSSHRTTLIRRGCDLAIDEVIRISGHPFSFKLSSSSQYSEAQIAEVIKFVEKFPK